MLWLTFPLTPAPNRTARDRDPRSIKVGPDIRYVAKYLDMRTRKLKNLRRGFRSNHLEDAFRDLRPHQGKDVPAKVKHGIDVRRMRESSHEDDIAAVFVTWNVGTTDRNDVRDEPDVEAWAFLLENISFDRADHQRQIGARSTG